MGLNTRYATWGYGGRGTTPIAHIEECLHDCAVPAPVCIWDAQFAADGWHEPEVWQALHQIRLSGEPTSVSTMPGLTPGTILPEPVKGLHLLSAITSLYSVNGRLIGNCGPHGRAGIKAVLPGTRCNAGFSEIGAGVYILRTNQEMP